jgi:hypothetical protein
VPIYRVQRRLEAAWLALALLSLPWLLALLLSCCRERKKEVAKYFMAFTNVYESGNDLIRAVALFFSAFCAIAGVSMEM